MVRSHESEAEGTVRRLKVLSLAGLVAIAAGGCQSYERRPLDMPGHQSAFLARTPESSEVRAFAESLAAKSTGSSGEAVAFDPRDGISCGEAEVIAVVFNADLRVARLRAGVTQATAENAGPWEDPTIGADLTRIIESTPEPWKVFTSVGLTIPISGRLEIEKQRAGVEHAAELARVAQREWSVRMSVRRAWSEWSAMDAQLAVTRDFLSRVDQILSVVDKMELAGEMARTEARLPDRSTKARTSPVVRTRSENSAASTHGDVARRSVRLWRGHRSVDRLRRAMRHRTQAEQPGVLSRGQVGPPESPRTRFANRTGLARWRGTGTRTGRIRFSGAVRTDPI